MDCTLGAGGHAQGILEASQPDGKLLGLDLDPQAVTIAGKRLTRFAGRVRIERASYVELTRVLESIGWENVDGIVFDLGVSSMQFDTPERGFSFLQDAPLDRAPLEWRDGGHPAEPRTTAPRRRPRDGGVSAQPELTT